MLSVLLSCVGPLLCEGPTHKGDTMKANKQDWNERVTEEIKQKKIQRMLYKREAQRLYSHARENGNNHSQAIAIVVDYMADCLDEILEHI